MSDAPPEATPEVIAANDAFIATNAYQQTLAEKIVCRFAGEDSESEAEHLVKIIAAVLADERVMDPATIHDCMRCDRLEQQLAAVRAELNSKPLMITAHQVKLLEDRIEFQQKQLATLRGEDTKPKE